VKLIVEASHLGDNERLRPIVFSLAKCARIGGEFLPEAGKATDRVLESNELTKRNRLEQNWVSLLRFLYVNTCAVACSYMAQLCMPSGPSSLYSLLVRKPLLMP